MTARFRTLADHAATNAGKGGRTAGILFSCSAFGPAIDAVKARVTIPVLRPNEAAFEAALSMGDKLGLVVSFAPSRASLEEELRAMANERHRDVTIRTAVAAGALEALKAGDADRHDLLVADAAARLVGVSTRSSSGSSRSPEPMTALRYTPVCLSSRRRAAPSRDSEPGRWAITRRKDAQWRR